MSDVFREVNDDLRREQLKALWKRFGIYVIGAAVLIVLVVAGYQVFASIDANRSAEAGDRFQAAANLLVDGDVEGAEAAFQAIVEDGYGDYEFLALMSIAAIRAEAGDINGAVTAYDTVAGNADAEPALRDVAHIRAGYLLADTLTPDQMTDRLATFIEEGNPFRTLALEALVLTAINAEDYDRAMAWVIDMVEDPFADEAISARANVLFSYITARQAELNPVAPTPAPAAGVDPFATPAPATPAPAAPATPTLDGTPPGFAANPGAVNEGATPTPGPAGPLQFQLPGQVTPLLPFLPGANDAAPAAE